MTSKRRTSGRVVELAAIWVDPGHRGGQPDGSSPVVDGLIDEAARLASADRRVHSLTLGVADDNARARAAYERNGFGAIGPGKGRIAPFTEMDHVLEVARKPFAPAKYARRRNQGHTKTGR